MNRRRFLKYAIGSVAVIVASALGLDYLLRPELPVKQILTSAIGTVSTVSNSSTGLSTSAPTTSVSRTSISVVSVQERLDELLEPIRQQYDVPALTAAFVRGGDLVGLGAVGVRRLGATASVQLNDQWHLGSCTKSMTATLIAILIEQGKLQWDSTIADVFPDLLNRIRPDFYKLTLRELLSHRGGIPGQQQGQSAYTELQDQLWELSGPLPQQRRAVVELVLSQSPVSQPGSIYDYSNLGYIIAGAFAEQVTGQQWEQLIQQMLFKPLGMENSGFGVPGTPGKLDQPWGHTGSCEPLAPGSKKPPADNPPVLGPAGTVHSSMIDWARYAALHLLGAQGEQGLLLKPQTFQVLHNDQYNQGYALGWFVARRTWAAGLTFSHGGSNTLWYADIWIVPNRNAAFLAATNTADCPSEGVGFKACDAAISTIVSRYL